MVSAGNAERKSGKKMSFSEKKRVFLPAKAASVPQLLQENMFLPNGKNIPVLLAGDPFNGAPVDTRGGYTPAMLIFRAACKMPGVLL